MAIQPTHDQSSNSISGDFSIVGPDTTAAFEPAGSPSSPMSNASSENLLVAPRTPALDEEDEVEDDDPDEEDDADDEDDLEDDEDEDLADDDDELEDDEDDAEDDEDEDEDDEEEDEEDEDDTPKKK